MHSHLVWFIVACRLWDSKYEAVDLSRKNGCEGKIFRNSSNMARIGAKLRKNAFQPIPDVSFFDVEKKFSSKMLDRKFVFRRFGVVFEGLRPNGPQNQLPRQILL